MQIEPMYGWRCRIGRLTPSTTLEGIEEWRRWSPDGVATVPSLINLDKLDHSGLRDMMAQVERAAADVSQALVDVIIQCCSPGIFAQGYGADQGVIDTITRLTNIPATTMMLSTLDAMRALGFKKVAVASFYEETLNDDLCQYLTKAGLDVAAIEGMDIGDPKALPFIGPEESFRTMMKSFRRAGQVDGILFCGGAVRTFEVISAAEEATDIPVVTSNQAALWRVLRMAGVTDVVPGLGKLMTIAEPS